MVEQYNMKKTSPQIEGENRKNGWKEKSMKKKIRETKIGERQVMYSSQEQKNKLWKQVVSC